VSHPFRASWSDYPDNESLSVLVYVVGCAHGCEKCHNPQFQSLDNNPPSVVPMRIETLIPTLREECRKNRTNKVVLTGGDPLFSDNLEFITILLEQTSTEFDYCLYTGYELDRIRDYNISGFKFVKTGTYMADQSQTPQKTDEKFVLASKNQKIYNDKLSLLTKDGILFFEPERTTE